MPRPKHPSTHRAARHGFTLLEMMLVVVIIGLIATVAVVNFAGQGNQARVGITVTRMSQIQSALTQYQMTHGAYPDSLDPLVPGLLQKIPVDGWNKRIAYYFPSATSTSDGNGASARPFDLISSGIDGKMNTSDDINVWTMDSAGAAAANPAGNQPR